MQRAPNRVSTFAITPGLVTNEEQMALWHLDSQCRIAPRASSPHLRFITRKRSRSSRNNNRGEFFRNIADQFFDMVIERYDSYRSIGWNGNPVSPGIFSAPST